jgi:hypothetical protein
VTKGGQVAKCIVVWSNGLRAIIVSIVDGVEQTLHVDSKGGRPVKVGRGRHRPTEHYREVVKAIGDAQSIFVFGPAQAKMDLRSEILRTEGLSHRLVGTELAESMTDSEIVARAREICGSGGA